MRIWVAEGIIYIFINNFSSIRQIVTINDPISSNLEIYTLYDESSY